MTAPVIGSMNEIYRSVLTSQVLLTNALVDETILVLMSSAFIPWELFMILVFESIDIVSQPSQDRPTSAGDYMSTLAPGGEMVRKRTVERNGCISGSEKQIFG
jgi:hypothetical protein